jgi:hypothetical protein
MKIKRFSIYKISNKAFNVIGLFDTPEKLPVILRRTKTEEQAKQVIENLKKRLER